MENMLAKRSEQAGFAIALLRQLVSASEAEDDVREQMMAFVASLARRELAEGGKLA